MWFFNSDFSDCQIIKANVRGMYLGIDFDFIKKEIKYRIIKIIYLTFFFEKDAD